MIITLIGFMAAGKTFIGRKLAESLKAPFVDLDAYIEEKEGKTIAEIFESKGESAFRVMEENHLEDLLEEHIASNPETLDDRDAPDKKCTLVISLGGGAVMSPVCRNLIRDLTYCIYVKTDVGVIFRRLQDRAEREKRPLLKGEKDLRDSIEALYYEREQYYEELAQSTVDGSSCQ